MILGLQSWISIFYTYPKCVNVAIFVKLLVVYTFLLVFMVAQIAVRLHQDQTNYTFTDGK